MGLLNRFAVRPKKIIVLFPISPLFLKRFGRSAILLFTSTIFLLNFKGR